MEKNLDIDLYFDKKPLDKFFPIGEFITGKITFTPVRNLAINILGLRLVLETRGRVDVQEKILQEERFITNETIYKDERYSFPFKLYNERYETYKGNNVSFLIKVEPFLRLTKASDNSLLNKLDILSVYTPKERTTTARYLYFKDDAYSYKVFESIEALDFKSSTNNLLGFAFLYLLSIVLLSIIGYLNLFSFKLSTFIAFTIGLLLLFVLFEYLFSSLIIGNIIATFNNGEKNKLQLKLTNGLNWKQVDKLSIHYEIKEEVIDRRGTSDTTKTKSIFIGKKQVFKSPNRTVETDLLLTKKQPATTKVGDARIYWQLLVKTDTIFGFSFNYKTEFTITKEKLIP